MACDLLDGKLAPVAFAGCFIAISCLQALGGLLVQLVRIPRPSEHERSRFLLTAPPLRMPGVVGSPVTPVATV